MLLGLLFIYHYHVNFHISVTICLLLISVIIAYIVYSQTCFHVPCMRSRVSYRRALRLYVFHRPVDCDGTANIISSLFSWIGNPQCDEMFSCYHYRTLCFQYELEAFNGAICPNSVKLPFAVNSGIDGIIEMLLKCSFCLPIFAFFHFILQPRHINQHHYILEIALLYQWVSARKR